MADCEEPRRLLVNGHNKQNGIILNGTTGGSSDDGDQRSLTSISSSTKRSSEGSLRELPALPKETSPPPLPIQPPREKLPPRMKQRAHQSAPKFIPEQEISIPSDGNLSSFSVEDMTTFFKHMGVSDRIVNHLNKKNLDGKKFSKLKDADLETIGISNPIIQHFRDKSIKVKSKRLPFML